MNAPTRDDLADAADLALTTLAQKVAADQQLTLIATLRPAISKLRNGGNDWRNALHWVDALAPSEMGLPLRRAIIAFSVTVAS